MDIDQIVEGAIGILSFAMLFMAFRIVTGKTVNQMIVSYQFQSIFLAIVTVLTALQPGISDEANRIRVIMTVVVLPVILAVFIESLLAQATIASNLAINVRLKNLFYFTRQYRENRSEIRKRAIGVWLEQESPRARGVGPLATSMALVVISFIFAYSLIPGRSPDTTSFAVTIALLLLGLFMMSIKEDIISQMMGLLVMEHGLFLGAIRVIALPSVAVGFVFSLFVYIIITLTILIFLLPELHYLSGSTKVEDQDKLNG